jgi:hypothetical protein
MFAAFAGIGMADDLCRYFMLHQEAGKYVFS